jgi:hypothetical protein
LYILEQHTKWQAVSDKWKAIRPVWCGQVSSTQPTTTAQPQRTLQPVAPSYPTTGIPGYPSDQSDTGLPGYPQSSTGYSTNESASGNGTIESTYSSLGSGSGSSSDSSSSTNYAGLSAAGKTSGTGDLLERAMTNLDTYENFVTMGKVLSLLLLIGW